MRLTWRRFRVLAERLAAIPDSAFLRSVKPEYAGWTRDTHFQADIVDLLQIGNWMQTQDGAKGRRRPQRVERPGTEEAAQERAAVAERSLRLWKENRAKVHAEQAATT